MSMEKSPLFDAKFMLFIDDREFEILKRNIFLDDRVRTDDDIDMSCDESSFDLFFMFRSQRSGQEFYSDAKW